MSADRSQPYAEATIKNICDKCGTKEGLAINSINSLKLCFKLLQFKAISEVKNLEILALIPKCLLCDSRSMLPYFSRCKIDVKEKIGWKMKKSIREEKGRDV